MGRSNIIHVKVNNNLEFNSESKSSCNFMVTNINPYKTLKDPETREYKQIEGQYMDAPYICQNAALLLLSSRTISIGLSHL